jgi:DNA repair exonuclease SbcCD nuclease subunit
MKTLYVGDPHVTVEELADCEALLRYTYHVAQEEVVDRIVFLGDLFNNFSLTNVKVTAFWDRWFSTLKDQQFAVIALVGNHDMLGDGSGFPHALIPFKHMVTVVDEPVQFGHTLFLPYIANPNLFLGSIKPVGDGGEVKLVVCHQEFNGAMYDNGFYSPFGVNPQLMTTLVISGHIHTRQWLGKVYYLGAPRWRTLSDAASPTRAIVVHDDETDVFQDFYTNDYVRRIHQVILTPADAYVPQMQDKDEYRIHVEGPAAWVKEVVPTIKGKNVRISTVNTDDRVVRVRESEGVDAAFGKYVDTYAPKMGTPNAILKEMAFQRL